MMTDTPLQPFVVPTRHHHGCLVVADRPLADALRYVWQPGWKHAAVIADSNTGALFGDAVDAALSNLGVRVQHARFRAGEASKVRATKARLEDELLVAEIDRDTCVVVAVGGGVALDLAGFVAATALRGLPAIYVATSLLAMVDAAIGGKVAVNVPAGKNLVGVYHPPRAVVLHLDGLRHLPPLEVRNGLVEMVKHGVVADHALFTALEAWVEYEPLVAPPPAMIATAARVKAAVVAEDEGESGRRRILNFGHTLGHALEAASEHAIPHGAAVAIGMRVEARVAAELGLLAVTEQARIDALLQRITPMPPLDLPFSRLEPFLRRDKKNVAGHVMCALPTAIGEMDAADGDWRRPVLLQQLAQHWEAVLDLARRPPAPPELDPEGELTTAPEWPVPDDDPESR